MSKTAEHTDHFIIPIKYYAITFIALLILTLITVYSSKLDFGLFNIIIAMAIAFIKASLIALFFMGQRWENGFNRIALISSLLFIGIFLVLTSADVFTRSNRERIEGRPYKIDSPVKIIVPGQETHHQDSHQDDHQNDHQDNHHNGH